MTAASAYFVSVPAFLLGVWVLYEWARRRLGQEQAGWRLAGWALRPWALWSVFSLFYRANRERGLEYLETGPTYISEIFPFFAQPWNRSEGMWEATVRLVQTPTVWTWGAVVCALAAVVVLVVRRPQSETPMTARHKAGLLVGLFLLAGMLHLSVACLPNGAWSTEEREGSLLSCWHAHSTVLYAVPFVKTKSHFLRNFAEIQPRLRITIHALSHPPGAALSMYYLGKLAGAEGMNIRLDSTRIRYALALTFFSALNVFVLFGLGRSLFRNDTCGFTAAALWLTAPSVLAYSTFAQDGLYAVFFNLSLLLTWVAATSKRPPYLLLIALGFVFSCLNFLNYSWCLVTSIFALFLLYMMRLRRWSFREFATRAVIPLGVMTVVSGAILLDYRLDYLSAYSVSSGYVGQWYQFETVYQHVVAWIGGQFDVFMMLGAVTCSAFFISMFKSVREKEWQPHTVFLLIILFIYALPILFGPTCLRVETARCWNWVMAVPICFAARELLSQERPRYWLTGAVLVSLGTYTTMRLYLNFAP